MRPRGRTGLVLAGYVAAFILAVIGFLILRVDSSLPDNQGGMAAFGDFLLFCGLWSILSLAPTALWLVFLRPYPRFWRVFAVACVLLAATGPIAALMMGPALAPAWVLLHLLALLKVLGAPVLAFGFLVCAAIAPVRRARLTLLGAATVEAVTAAYAFICLFILQRWPV